MTDSAYARAGSASSAKVRFFRGKSGDFVISLRELAPVDHIRTSSVPSAENGTGGGRASRKHAYVNFASPRPVGEIAAVTQEKSLARPGRPSEATTRSGLGRSDDRTGETRASLAALLFCARAGARLADRPRWRRARPPADRSIGDDARRDQPGASRTPAPTSSRHRGETLPTLRLVESADVRRAMPTMRRTSRGAS